MKLLIKNNDEVETILISALPKDADSRFEVLGATLNRAALRPGEEKRFTLDEGYILGLEKL